MLPRLHQTPRLSSDEPLGDCSLRLGLMGELYGEPASLFKNNPAIRPFETTTEQYEELPRGNRKCLCSRHDADRLE